MYGISICSAPVITRHVLVLQLSALHTSPNMHTSPCWLAHTMPSCTSASSLAVLASDMLLACGVCVRLAAAFAAADSPQERGLLLLLPNC